MVAVHDLHASTVSTGMPVLMAHVVVDPGLSMAQGRRFWLSCKAVCASISRCQFRIRPSSLSRPGARRLARNICMMRRKMRVTAVMVLGLVTQLIELMVTRPFEGMRED